jgi:hypothetical protein
MARAAAAKRRHWSATAALACAASTAGRRSIRAPMVHVICTRRAAYCRWADAPADEAEWDSPRARGAIASGECAARQPDPFRPANGAPAARRT